MANRSGRPSLNGRMTPVDRSVLREEDDAAYGSWLAIVGVRLARPRRPVAPVEQSPTAHLWDEVVGHASGTPASQCSSSLWPGPWPVDRGHTRPRTCSRSLSVSHGAATRWARRSWPADRRRGRGDRLAGSRRSASGVVDGIRGRSGVHRGRTGHWCRLTLSLLQKEAGPRAHEVATSTPAPTRADFSVRDKLAVLIAAASFRRDECVNAPPLAS